MKILKTIDSTDDLRALEPEQLPQLCAEIREFLINNIAVTGGHLASNLGVVELTVALHRVYDPMSDRLVFDVGHQCYTHKLLTGRRGDFSGLRQFGGMSGFPKPCESKADAFIAGHASNSVSVALGMAKARTAERGDYDVAAVIGDGALTGGLAYEGLAGAGQSGEPMVVILNDNAMSIGNNVGGVAKLLSGMRVRPGYFRLKRAYRNTIGKVPPLYRFLHVIKEDVKNSILPDNMFDDLGFYYLGPVDGHDLVALEAALRWAKDMRIPVLLHVITQKGRGYIWAERDPEKYHGVGPFDPDTGILKNGGRTFSDLFGKTACELAEQNPRITALTAAMTDGTGLSGFMSNYSERFCDVGIAEEHMVSMAAGMAKQGLVPLVAVYSSFLQRAYDMLMHDVALQRLHVVFCVDRAGLVGGDGATHHGVFDVAYLSSVPGMTLYAPSSFAELREYLRRAALEDTGPVAVRYPRDGEGEYKDCALEPVSVLREGSDVTVAVYGRLVNSALCAARELTAQGISIEIVKISRLVPLETGIILSSVAKTRRLLVAEESCAAGSVGEALLASLSGKMEYSAKLLNLRGGVAVQGSVPELLSHYGLDGAGVALAVREMMT